ncbi:restriction endonuclease subunit S [Bacillus altitudinis]|uniref:restriction endonuclease subunit S n=1 Tax=Bacillus altitudinis TaxID=293387 RepID=UPI00096793DF|nr:restriction endonuclease subunit S [Bacillus altitudinis]SIT92434.1 type I restriction enzyme, S subunit [Bacillus altitudinis]
MVSEWSNYTLKDIVDIEYGKSPKNVKVDYSGIPIFGTSGKVGYASKALFEGPLIMIGRKGTIDKPLLIKGDCWIIDTAYAAKPKQNVNIQWLYYCLINSKLEKLNEATGVPSLNRENLYNLKLKVPPLNEQRKVASILTSVDETIDKTKAVIEQIEKVKKGLMQQLLTKGIGHTRFKKTEIGEIPEEWEVLLFNDVLGFVGSGITPKGGSTVYQLEGIPFIRSQNVYPDGLRLDDIAFISEVIHEKMNRSKVQEQDVLLNITGASIGRCTYVPIGFGEANVNQHVCILRSNGKINYKYLAYFLNSSLGQRQIFSEQAGQTREGLNYQQIRSFRISVPPIAEQEKIASIIESFNQKANNERKKLNTLKYLKKGLMQSLLTGKVRVNVDEAEVTQV